VNIVSSLSAFSQGQRMIGVLDGNTLLSNYKDSWLYNADDMQICLREKNNLSLRLSLRVNKILSLSSPTIDVYIKTKHDCRTIPLTYLLIFIYHSLHKHRTSRNDNADDQSKGLFDYSLGFGSNKLPDIESAASL
jgi:hypothetical protein